MSMRDTALNPTHNDCCKLALPPSLFGQLIHLSKGGDDYCDELTRRAHCRKGIPASILIGKGISLPQCGSEHISGLVGNSKPKDGGKFTARLTERLARAYLL